MTNFNIRDFSDTSVGYLMGLDGQSLLFVHGGTFVNCFKKYVEWEHGNDNKVFFKAIEVMTTLEEILDLYENYFSSDIDIIIKCRYDDIAKGETLDIINCHNGD